MRQGWASGLVFILALSVPSARALGGQKHDIEKYCLMLHSLDDGERVMAVDELVKIGKPAVPSLIAALSGDPVYLGREGAAVALGRIRDPRAVKPLVAALKDEYQMVRQQACLALSEIGGRKAVDEVLGSLEGGSDDFLEAAAAALGLLNDRRALPALEKLAKHPSQIVAAAAAEAIRQIGG